MNYLDWLAKVEAHITKRTGVEGAFVQIYLACSRRHRDELESAFRNGRSADDVGCEIYHAICRIRLDEG